METTPQHEAAAIVAGNSVAWLRGIIAYERSHGRAFGVMAEAARHELARRGEQA